MCKNWKDVAELMLGVLIFLVVFVIAEKSGVRNSLISSEALLSKSLSSPTGFMLRELSYDAGRVFMHKGDIRHTFRISNGEKEEVVIKKIYSTCQCLDIFLKTRGSVYGPFNLRDYLDSGDKNIVVGSGDLLEIEVVYRPSMQGPFGVGFSQPFGVIENEFGEKTHIRMSALVFP